MMSILIYFPQNSVSFKILTFSVQIIYIHISITNPSLNVNDFLQIKQGTLISHRWEFGAKFSAEISEELIGHMLRCYSRNCPSGAGSFE